MSNTFYIYPRSPQRVSVCFSVVLKLYRLDLQYGNLLVAGILSGGACYQCWLYISILEQFGSKASLYFSEHILWISDCHNDECLISRDQLPKQRCVLSRVCRSIRSNTVCICVWYRWWNYASWLSRLQTVASVWSAPVPSSHKPNRAWRRTTTPASSRPPEM